MPDATTYKNLLGSKFFAVTGLRSIAMVVQITPRAILVKAENSDAIYLTCGDERRHVSDPVGARKIGFDAAMIK